MKHLTILCTFLAVVGPGCNKKKSDATPPTPGSNVAVGSGSAAGSGSGAGSAAPHVVKVPSGTSADFAQRFEGCWGFWNAGKFDDFKGCFTADAVNDTPGSGQPEIKGSQAIADAIKQYKTAFPDQKGDVELAMVNGKTIISVVLITGTNAGTKKKIGIELAEVLDLDDAGHVTHESDFFDEATMLGQITPSDHPVRPAADKPMLKEVAIATGDDREKANLAAFGKLSDAFNKHDRKAATELVAVDVVWTEVASPKDVDKKGALDGLEQLWKGFSKLKFTVTKSWAAGDYVAALQSFDGTNDGPLAMLGTKATNKKVSLPFLAVYKLDSGKIQRAWIFYQSTGLVTQLGLVPPPPAK